MSCCWRPDTFLIKVTVRGLWFIENFLFWLRLCRHQALVHNLVSRLLSLENSRVAAPLVVRILLMQLKLRLVLGLEVNYRLLIRIILWAFVLSRLHHTLSPQGRLLFFEMDLVEVGSSRQLPSGDALSVLGLFQVVEWLPWWLGAFVFKRTV